MGGNKIVYREAFERALSGKSRSLAQRLLFRFQDHYTQASRRQGELDGAAARAARQALTVSAPATPAAP